MFNSTPCLPSWFSRSRVSHCGFDWIIVRQMFMFIIVMPVVKWSGTILRSHFSSAEVCRPSFSMEKISLLTLARVVPVGASHSRILVSDIIVFQPKHLQNKFEKAEEVLSEAEKVAVSAYIRSSYEYYFNFYVCRVVTIMFFLFRATSISTQLVSRSSLSTPCMFLSC